MAPGAGLRFIFRPRGAAQQLGDEKELNVTPEFMPPNWPANQSFQ